jgi:predicted small metal-binding protein
MCTLALSADTKEELLEAAVQHAVKVHGHDDTADFREQLMGAMKEGTPRA